MAVGPKLRFEIFKKYNFTCQYCGRSTPEVILELDHVIPKAEGGDDDEKNLIASCWECNRGKGATPLTNILKNGDIHEQTVLLAEREMQLKEYNHIKAQIRQREDDDIAMIWDHFLSQFDYVSKSAEDPPSNLLRQALRKVDRYEICEHIDYAVIKTRDNRRGYSWSEATMRYLIGICRNVITERDKPNAVSEP